MMKKFMLSCGRSARRAVAVLSLAVCAVASVQAERFQLPTTEEIAPFSREAIIFYNAGVNSLDRSDYMNAYTNLAKAAQLQPEAVQLNLLVAGLSTRMGRGKPQDEAVEYYDTAQACLENILAQKNLEDKFRRQIYNRLKIAKREQSELSQRDTVRANKGGDFIVELNKTIVPDKTPEPTKKTIQPASPEVIRQLVTTPTPQPGQQGQPGQPGGEPGANPARSADPASSGAPMI